MGKYIDYNEPKRPKPPEDTPVTESRMKALYLCDREQCEKCRDDCEHTTDINHSKNFKRIADMYVEQESGGDVFITNNYFGKQEIEEASK